MLKLHGDVNDPKSIVLDRRSFVRYDARRRPLGGVLQATLLTKHLLIVGASMTDDNVIRLIHEVAELAEEHDSAPNLGTVLSLRADPLRADLWNPEFRYVDLSNEQGDLVTAGRQLEIFLDRVVLLAAERSAHLLDARYRELLPEAERPLAGRFDDLATAVAQLQQSGQGSSGWREVARALSDLGANVSFPGTPAVERDRIGDVPEASSEL